MEGKQIFIFTSQIRFFFSQTTQSHIPSASSSIHPLPALCPPQPPCCPSSHNTSQPLREKRSQTSTSPTDPERSLLRPNPNSNPLPSTWARPAPTAAQAHSAECRAGRGRPPEAAAAACPAGGDAPQGPAVCERRRDAAATWWRGQRYSGARREPPVPPRAGPYKGHGSAAGEAAQGACCHWESGSCGGTRRRVAAAGGSRLPQCGRSRREAAAREEGLQPGRWVSARRREQEGRQEGGHSSFPAPGSASSPPSPCSSFAPAAPARLRERRLPSTRGCSPARTREGGAACGERAG